MSLLQKNRLYKKRFIGAIRQSVRKANALRAVMAYRAALKATWQDSGQFADNWFIKIGVTGVTYPPRFERGGYRVGKRGDQRSQRGRAQRVVSMKLRQVGINNNNPATTSLFASLAHKSGILDIQWITIYNPLYDKGRASGHNTPKPYWYYAAEAHPGHQVEQAVEHPHTVVAHLLRSLGDGDDRLRARGVADLG